MTQAAILIHDILESHMHAMSAVAASARKPITDVAELRQEIEGRWTGFSTPELREIQARLTAGAPASMMSLGLRGEIGMALAFRDMHGEPA